MKVFVFTNLKRDISSEKHLGNDSVFFSINFITGLA